MGYSLESRGFSLIDIDTDINVSGTHYSRAAS